jgi:hypothetical protein
VEYYSLKELESQVENEDIELECSITLRADISMERPHNYIKDERGNLKLVLGNGWLVSLLLPTKATIASEDSPFADGEKQMIGDLLYQSGEEHVVYLEDALRALGIPKDAKVWRVHKAS